MKKKKSVWTKNFTCITVATILSAIAGEAMTIPISLLVYDQTQSTFLVAVLLVISMLPDIIFSVLIAPLIDKSSKKKWIVGMDVILLFTYISMGFVVTQLNFNYLIYVIYTFVIATISVLYRIAYNALYPDMITAGFEQKGYAVSGMIYPSIIIVMAPVATFLYIQLEMSQIFFLVAVFLFLSICVEMNVSETRKISKKEVYTFTHYKNDLFEGFNYFKQEKGIRNIYVYMGITNGISGGCNTLIQAFFQSSPSVSLAMYGFLTSAEMIGRVISGFFQYIKEIPVKKRYLFTKVVYTIYEVFTSIILFVPFYGMVAIKGITGALGSASATIRESAIQSYLPSNMRARVSAIMNMFFSILYAAFQCIGGIIGEFIPYEYGVLGLSLLCLVFMYILIILPKEDNKKIYEAVRDEK